MKFIDDIPQKNIQNKTCFLRLDLNVQDEELKHSIRIERSISVIKYLLKNNCKIIIISHRGRPQERRLTLTQTQTNADKSITLKPFVEIFKKMLKINVFFDNSFDFKKIKNKINKLLPKSILVLENIRLIKGEEKNDPKFGKILASLGDFYINDAFSVSHRENASVCAITKYLPSYGGLEMKDELKSLNKVMTKPQKPLTLILGGAKISDKIGVIEKFYNQVDYILLGGGVANTFFSAQNIPIGDSIFEKDMIPKIKKYLNSKKIIMPKDVVFDGAKILDIGKETSKIYSDIIKSSKTVIWNGPMGLIEKKKFETGTTEVAKAIKNSKSFALIGGGETTSFLLKRKILKNQKSVFLSIGGGAMLEYLSGKKLPGLL